MGICPYMSQPYISSATINYTGDGGSGPTSGTDTMIYGTDTIAPGLMKIVCRTTECQLWDASANQCGTNSVTMKNRFDLTIGISAERDNNQSLLVYLKSMIGISAERDDSKSLISYLKSMIGISAERDNNQSLLVYLKSMIGISAERDTTNPSYSGGMSLVQWYKNIIGIYSDRSSVNTKTGNTENESLLRVSNTGTTYQNAPSIASKLMTEFLEQVDKDGNGLVYGKDFQFINPPPMLASSVNAPAFNKNAPSIPYTNEIPHL